MSEDDQGVQKYLKRQESVCFGEPAKVTNIRSQMKLLGPTTGLSLSGCFVEASNPFLEGTRIRVSIAHHDMVFEARGWVVQSHLIGEMEITFDEIEPAHQMVLDRWLIQNDKSHSCAVPQRYPSAGSASQ